MNRVTDAVIDCSFAENAMSNDASSSDDAMWRASGTSMRCGRSAFGFADAKHSPTPIVNAGIRSR